MIDVSSVSKVKTFKHFFLTNYKLCKTAKSNYMRIQFFE